MENEILRLNLLSPLYYIADEKSDPFEYSKEAGSGGEKLFCFDLDETQSQNFEPDKNLLMGNLIFRGKAPDGKTETNVGFFEFKPGNYLFAQKRELLGREDIIDLAAEIQAEALWQRLIPGKMLYLRYLFEDGKTVTQLFRPIQL